MRISSAGLESPTVTVKSARLQHDQRKIVSQQLCPSKLGDRSVNRLYQFVSALLRVHTRNLCQLRRRVLFSCLILSFDRPVSVQNQNVSVAQIDLVTVVVRIGKHTEILAVVAGSPTQLNLSHACKVAHILRS